MLFDEPPGRLAALTSRSHDRTRRCPAPGGLIAYRFAKAPLGSLGTRPQLAGVAESSCGSWSPPILSLRISWRKQLMGRAGHQILLAHKNCFRLEDDDHPNGHAGTPRDRSRGASGGTAGTPGQRPGRRPGHRRGQAGRPEELQDVGPPPGRRARSFARTQRMTRT